MHELEQQHVTLRTRLPEGYRRTCGPGNAKCCKMSLQNQVLLEGSALPASNALT